MTSVERLTQSALAFIVSRFGPKCLKQQATSSWFCRCGGVARPRSNGRLTIIVA